MSQPLKKFLLTAVAATIGGTTLTLLAAGLAALQHTSLTSTLVWMMLAYMAWNKAEEIVDDL